MAKAIKSFSVTKETYDALVSLFKKHGASTSLSLFVEECLTKLLETLSETEEQLKKSEYYPDIMKFVIEKWSTDLLLGTSGLRFRLSGNDIMRLTPEPESSLCYFTTDDENARLGEYNPDEWDEAERPEALEALYWIEEYEAQKQRLPRAFTRLLKTGKYELSRDRRFLIEKKTGKRFISLGGTHVIEIVPRNEVPGAEGKK